MRFKKIPINILEKNDSELDQIISNLKLRPFAYSISELNGYIFLSEKLISEYKNDYKYIITKAIEYLRPHTTSKR